MRALLVSEYTAVKSLWRGRHLVVGFAAGKIPALPFNIALLKGASLVGVDSAQIRRREPEVYARITNDIASWLGMKVLEPPATQTFPFDRFMEAFDAISSRRAGPPAKLSSRWIHELLRESVCTPPRPVETFEPEDALVEAYAGRLVQWRKLYCPGR
jgi:hypothetical protein